MLTKTRRAALGAIACVAACCMAPGVAGAASVSPSSAAGSGLAVIQAKAAADISARVTSLNQAIPAVTANAVITSGDKATLLATLNNDLAGLTALGHTIAADSTAKQAATDAATIFTTYRVYALGLPQVRYAEATDDITGGALPRLTDADTTLAALLVGSDSAKNTPALQAAMVDLAGKISATSTATTGMSAAVLAYTPAQYDANHDLLNGPRQNLTTAQADIKAARGDIATVLGALS